MSSHEHKPLSPLTTTVLQSAVTGAVVGAAAATAMQLQHSTTKNLVASEIVQAGAISGVATAAVTLVGHSIGCQHPLPRVAAMFITGTALFYLLNQARVAKSTQKLTHQPVVSGESA